MSKELERDRLDSDSGISIDPVMISVALITQDFLLYNLYTQ